MAIVGYLMFLGGFAMAEGEISWSVAGDALVWYLGVCVMVYVFGVIVGVLGSRGEL